MIKLIKKYRDRIRNHKALIQECVDFCAHHEDFIINEVNPQTEEEILTGFQKLLDAGMLFKINFYYSLMGRAFLERGMILIKNGKKIYDDNGIFLFKKRV